MNGARAKKRTAASEGSRRRRGVRESMERLTENTMNRANTPLAILLSTEASATVAATWKEGQSELCATGP